MNNRVCYLCGAMSHWKDTPEYEEKAVKWRRLINELSDATTFTEVFDPTIIQTDEISWWDQCVVELNLDKLKNSTCVVAFAEQLDKSPGSIVELSYAHLNHIPVFWFGELEHKSPHLIRILGPNKYNSLDELMEALLIVYGRRDTSNYYDVE